MKSIFLNFLFFLFFAFPLIAQNQNNIWCFGTFGGATLDFNGGCSPVVTTGSSGYEGATSICDPITGQLLFQTDGCNVFDSNNNIMPGSSYGFIGESNTKTQNVIIPKPGSISLYYIFSTEVQAGILTNSNWIPGLNYSIVDMSLNGGLGQLTSVNVHLRDTANSEMLVGVRNGNGTDAWLIGHAYRTNEFFVYNVTAAGVDTVPVLSSIGSIVENWLPANFTTIGELKASPDGSKLAFTCYGSGTTCLFDFNKYTGQISNPVPLTINAGGYGISFSPDNSKLYINDVLYTTWANGNLWQFDISSGIDTVIQNSKTLIYNDPAGSFRGMQLGPDGKLYVTRIDGSGLSGYYLGVINSPDIAGSLCNYTHNGIYLSGMRGSWGLNNILDFYFCPMSVGTDQIEDEDPISIFPNPTDGIISLISRDWSHSHLSIYNVLGEQVYVSEINSAKTEIDLSKETNGIYFIKLITEKGITTKKMIKE